MKVSQLAHRAANSLLFVGMVALAACLSPATEAKVQAAISKNAANITNYCVGVINPIVSNPFVAAGVGAVAAATGLTPAAASAAGILKATCDPTNIQIVAKSASTVAYLAANKDTVTTNGAVVPPVIAPVPIVTGNEVGS